MTSHRFVPVSVDPFDGDTGETTWRCACGLVVKDPSEHEGDCPALSLLDEP